MAIDQRNSVSGTAMSADGRYIFGRANSSSPEGGSLHTTFRFDTSGQNPTILNLAEGIQDASILASDSMGARAIVVSGNQSYLWTAGDGLSFLGWDYNYSYASFSRDNSTAWLSTSTNLGHVTIGIWNPISGLQSFTPPADMPIGNVEEVLPDGSGALLSSGVIVFANGAMMDLRPHIRAAALAAGDTQTQKMRTTSVRFTPEGMFVLGSYTNGNLYRPAWTHLPTVPEPTTVFGLCAGLAALIARRRK